MREVDEYKLLLERNDEALNKIVNSFIKKGWQPYGDPFKSTQGNLFYLAQAVVRFK